MRILLHGILPLTIVVGCSAVPVVTSSESRECARLEREIFEAVNIVRSKGGLRKLVWDGRIAAAGRGHSKEMGIEGKLSHEGFRERMEWRSDAVLWRSSGENLTFSSPSRDIIRIIIEGWLGSAGHQKKIMGEYSLTGIGVTEGHDGLYYVTQIFIVPQ